MPRRRLAPEIAHLVDLPLDRESFLKRADRPMTEDELTETAALVRWFRRRYPTVKQRLDYVRRTFERWNRPLPRVARSRRRERGRSL